MIYKQTVIETPTGKFTIVGSNVDTEISGVFDTKEQADIALALNQIWRKFAEETDNFAKNKLKQQLNSLYNKVNNIS
jgi:hypothetical protein